MHEHAQRTILHAQKSVHANIKFVEPSTQSNSWVCLTIPWDQVFKGLNTLEIDMVKNIFTSKIMKYKKKNEKILN